MIPVAVYDANVLYPRALRDFLIRVAIEDLVRARWSEHLLPSLWLSKLDNYRTFWIDPDERSVAEFEELMAGK